MEQGKTAGIRGQSGVYQLNRIVTKKRIKPPETAEELKQFGKELYNAVKKLDTAIVHNCEPKVVIKEVKVPVKQKSFWERLFGK